MHAPPPRSIDRLRTLHQQVAETRSYEEWLRAVRAILKELPKVWEPADGAPD